ncbi:MAG: hypothetical protein ACJ768_19505 [Gaiellaceae bacterium]
MPFTWIRISSAELYGERVAALVAGLELEPIAALGHLVALCGQVSQHRPDGDIRTVSPVLLERWAEWRGERGAFAAVVLGELCDPPGILRDWLETMGKLVAEAEKDRRRKKAAYDKLRAAREAAQEHEQIGLGAPVSAEAGPALRGDSADSPDTRTYVRTDVRTNRDLSNGPDSVSKASSAGPVVDKPVEKGKSDPDPLAGLPPSARRLLALFYANAPGKRKRDVLEQLKDTIDPARPGARLERGTYVRARDVEQLETACALVLRDPPRDLDLGVRFVLHRLTELEARAAMAATEGAAAREAAEEQHLLAWRRARAIAVAKWEREHPEEVRDLLATAENDVPNDAVEAAGSLGRMVRVEHYAALVAAKIRFPSADAWKAPPKPPARTLARLGA